MGGVVIGGGGKIWACAGATTAIVAPARRPRGRWRERRYAESCRHASRSAWTTFGVAAGNDTKNVEPNPGSLSRLIRPPCISMNRFAIVSPMPVPRCVGKFDGDW